MDNRKKLMIGGGALVALIALVLIVMAVMGLGPFNDSADEANLGDAIDVLEEEAASTTEAGDAEAPATTGAPEVEEGLDGAYAVDTTIGDFADFTSSWLGFRIDEELTIGANTVTGRTPGVTGSLTLAGTTISEVTVTADMTTLTTDSGNRDNAIKNLGIETNTFPEATFTLTEPIELDTIPAPEVPVAVDAVGTLELHGVTNPITISIEAQLVGSTIAVTGNAPVALADYNIEKPVLGPVVSITDGGSLEFQLFLTK